MDSDILKFLLVAGVTIIIGAAEKWINRSKEERPASSRPSQPHRQAPRQEVRRPRTQPAQRPQARPVHTSTPRPEAPARQATPAPATPFLNSESEGARAVQSAPATPRLHPAAAQPRLPRMSRDKLKELIIWGEILRKKY